MPVIGIDLGGTTVKLGVVENGGSIIYRDTRPSPHDPEKMARLLWDMIVEARKRFPGARAAVSTAGVMDGEGYLDANQLDFWHAPLGKLLREKLGEQIPFENDGICAMMAEHAAGALRGIDSGIMITLGTGIGGGVLVNGKPYRGYRGVHAELGHMITHADGLPCSCGQRGCWECYASATALSKMAGGLPPREIINRVRLGEMQEIWQAYLYELAQGLISLCSIFYPEAICIGGGLSGAGELLMKGLRAQLEKEPGYKSYYSHVQVQKAHFGNDAGIIGAAAIVKESDG